MNKILETKYKIIEKESDPSRIIMPIDAVYKVPGKFFTKLLIRTTITPNQITVFATLLGITASSLLISQNYTVRILAIILLQTRIILDHVDGILARATNQCSILGQWLDRMLDYLCDFFLFFFVCLGTYLTSKNPNVWFLGFISLGGTMLNSMTIPLSKMSYPESHLQIREKVKKAKILNNFPYTRLNIYVLLTFFVLVNKLYWFLIVTAFYSFLFYLTTALYLGIKFKKGDKI